MRIDRRSETLTFRGPHGEPFVIEAHAPFAALLLGGSWAYSFSRELWFTVPLMALVVLVSIALHEIAHARVAVRMGMVPVRTVVHGLGGYVEIVDPAPSYVRDVRVALAGPAANLAIGVTLLAFAETAPLPNPGGFEIDERFVPYPSLEPVWVGVARGAGWLNVALAALNMLPAFPLDGSAVLVGLLSRVMNAQRARRAVARIGLALAYLQLALSLVGIAIGLLVWPFIRPESNRAVLLEG